MPLQKIDYFYIVIIFILLAISSFLFIKGSECHNNSFVYGAKVVKEATGIEIDCSCYASQTQKTFNPMHFNSTSVWFGDKYVNLE